MNSPESLREFIGELVRRGLPLDYAQRAAVELADHQQDLSEELQATGLDEVTATAQAAGRLGSTKSLLKQTVRGYQRRHWCGRWPLLTFFLGPLALLLASWIATCLVVALVSIVALNVIGIEEPSNDGIVSLGEKICMYCFTAWCLIVLPAMVVCFLSRRAFRAGLSVLWIALAALILSTITENVRCGFSSQISRSKPTNMETGEPISGDTAMLCVPYWIYSQSWRSLCAWYATNPQVLCQLLMPLAVAGLMIWLQRPQKIRGNQISPTHC
jgi:hypothetical protein